VQVFSIATIDWIIGGYVASIEIGLVTASRQIECFCLICNLSSVIGKNSVLQERQYLR
jgi:hypothetical protein